MRVLCTVDDVSRASRIGLKLLREGFKVEYFSHDRITRIDSRGLCHNLGDARFLLECMHLSGLFEGKCWGTLSECLKDVVATKVIGEGVAAVIAIAGEKATIRVANLKKISVEKLNKLRDRVGFTMEVPRAALLFEGEELLYALDRVLAFINELGGLCSEGALARFEGPSR